MMNLSEKIAQLPLDKQKQLLNKVLKDPIKYRIRNLSPQQNRMWFLYNLNPTDSAYISRFRFKFEGEISKDVLDKALEHLINRHNILRSFYFSIEGLAFQSWKDPETFSSEYIDGRIMSDDEIDKATLRLINLEKEIPIKVFYVKTTNSDDYIINIHHIVHDGWTMGLFLEEFLGNVESILENRGLPSRPSIGYDYMDYVDDCKYKRNSPRNTLDVSYWENYIGNDSDALYLTPIEEQDLVPANVYILPDPDLARRVHDKAKQENTTEYILLLSIFLYLLSIYNDKNNVNVGTPILNRETSNQLNCIGYFANTIIFKSNNNSSNYRKYLADITNRIHLHLNHGSYPFEWLVSDLGVTRRIDSTPLFNVVFSMQPKELMKNSAGEERIISGRKVSFSPYFSKYRTTAFYLMATAVETSDGLSIGFSYAKEFFTQKDIVKMRDEYLYLLEAVLSDKDIFTEDIRGKITGRFRRAKLEHAQEINSNIHLEEIEGRVSNIWEEVLGHNNFKPNQHFFDVGGNSINSFQLLKKLNDTFGNSITMANLFEYTTVQQIANYFERTKKESDSLITIQKF